MRAPKARLVLQDLRELDLPMGYDAAIALDATLGYIVPLAELRETLARIRGHLNEGGLFLFDVWYQPAVLADPPNGQAIHTRLDDGTEIVRVLTPVTDTYASTCTLHYELFRLFDPFEKHTEVHTMRFFTATELGLLLVEAGFTVEAFFAWPEFRMLPAPNAWHVGCMARAA